MLLDTRLADRESARTARGRTLYRQQRMFASLFRIAAIGLRPAAAVLTITASGTQL
jgi:hypothetical protein